MTPNSCQIHAMAMAMAMANACICMHAPGRLGDIFWGLFGDILGVIPLSLIPVKGVYGRPFAGLSHQSFSKRLHRMMQEIARQSDIRLLFLKESQPLQPLTRVSSERGGYPNGLKGPPGHDGGRGPPARRHRVHVDAVAAWRPAINRRDKRINSAVSGKKNVGG